MIFRLARVAALTGALLSFFALPSWADPVCEEYVLRESDDVGEIKSLLESLVPELKVDTDGRNLTITADSEEMLKQAMELLRQLDQPVDQVAVTAQLVGLSPSEQASLAIDWHRAAIGTSWGSKLLDHFIGRSPKPLTGLPGPLPVHEIIVKSGQKTDFSWSDPISYHSVRDGQVMKQTTVVGVDLEVTPFVKSDGYVFCKMVSHTRLPDRVIETVTDLRTRSGESTAIGNLFPVESRLPAFAYLPVLGSLFKPPVEPVLILTPNILAADQVYY